MNIAVGIPCSIAPTRPAKAPGGIPWPVTGSGSLGGHVNRCQRARNSSRTGGTGGSPFGGITGIVTEEDDDSAIGRLRAEVNMRLRNSTRQPGISQFVRGRSAFAFDFHAAAAAGAGKNRRNLLVARLRSGNIARRSYRMRVRRA